MKDRDSNISATEVTERMAAMGRQTGKSGCMTPASDSPDHMAAFAEDVRRMWGLGEKHEITSTRVRRSTEED